MGRPARIGIDGRFLSERYPGIGRYLFELLRGLVALDPEEELSILVHPECRKRFDLGELEGGRARVVETGDRPRSWGEQASLPRWASESRLDLFHTPFWWSAAFLPCPLVVTLHDLIPLRVPATLPSSLGHLAYRLATTRVARRAARILTPSEASRRDLVERLGAAPERVVVIPDAAGERFRRCPPQEVAALRRRLSLPRRYVLHIGLDRPHKNLRRLLAAWGELAAEGIDAALVVAGFEAAGAGAARGPASCLPSGSIRFIGPVAEADLPAVYSGAELFVMPSLWEGFGLPLVEAMACATPVACSDIAPLREVAGGAALLFDPEEIGDLARVLRGALRDPDRLSSLAEASRRRAADFSWERSARATLEVYRQAARRRP